jgi:hypothetical protein
MMGVMEEHRYLSLVFVCHHGVFMANVFIIGTVYY